MRKTILIEARRLIESGERQYICHAIEDAGNLFGVKAEADLLRREIHRALDGRAALDGWLASQYIGTNWVTPEAKGLQALMRMAWLDKMIEETP